MNKHRYKHILLVTTEGVETEATEQTAYQLAKRSDAKVTIVDSIRTPFHLPSSDSVSTNRMFDIAMKVKRDYLDKVAEPFRVDGTEVETQVFEGSRSSEEIIRFAKAKNCDLIVRYRKGENSRMPGLFGQTANNLMRACPLPLLLVGDNIISDPKVLACINSEHGIEENSPIFHAAEQLAKTNAKLHALCCWNMDASFMFEEEIYDDSDYKPDREETQDVSKQIYADLQDKYELTSFGNRVHVRYGNPIDFIPKYCADHKMDVAVTSSASLEHPLGRLIGSTIEGIMEKLPCALLVVKPMGFKSPVDAARAAQTISR